MRDRTNKTKATKRPVVEAASAAIEMLESRQMLTAAFSIGIGVNDGSSSFMNNAAWKLQGLGVQTVRLYYTTDFSDHSWNGVLQRAIDYSNRGFDVMLAVVPQSGNVYSTSAIQGWFQWAMSNSSLKNAVDRWEIGNEPDHSNYWQGSLSQYVTNLLEPAYDVLHAAGEEVVSAGPSWNPQDVQTMINAGLLDYTDYVGFHPYAAGVAGVEKSLAGIKAVVAGRAPLVASEWNVRGLEGNQSAWAAADAAVYADIASTFAINYYYAAEKVGSPAGPAGIMYSNGSENQPFWNAFASFRTGGDPIDAAPVTTPPVTTPPVTTPPVTTPPSTGNTPAGTLGSIAGAVFNDTNANGVFDKATESGSGARTIFLDSNGNGVLDAGEKSVQSDANGSFKIAGLAPGKYNITRIFPAGYHLSNTAAKDVVVTVNPGQAVTGFYIGSTKAKNGSNPVVTTPVVVAPVVTSPVPTTPVVAPVVTAPTIANLEFVTSAGAAVAGLDWVTGDKTINLSSLSTLDLGIAAIVSGTTHSAKLTMNGSTAVDNLIGYTFLPETNGKYKTFHAKAGKYVFKATAYAGLNATGTASTTKTFTITFT